MSSWMSDYLAALAKRDVGEQAERLTIDAYTRLADRSARQYYDLTTHASTPSASSGHDPAIAVTDAAKQRTTSSGSPTTHVKRTGPIESPAEYVRLRSDLAAAQKSKAALASELAAVKKEHGELSLSVSTERRTTALLQRQKIQLERKLRDRESELKEKSRLIENVQDEMVGLQLELNVTEDKARKTAAENAELVDRWMKRVGAEAQQMNEEYKWN